MALRAPEAHATTTPQLLSEFRFSEVVQEKAVKKVCNFVIFKVTFIII